MPRIFSPYRVALLVLMLAISLTPANAKQNSLENVLNDFVGKSELAGAVAVVADKDKILERTSVGFADVHAKEPMATGSGTAARTRPTWRFTQPRGL